MSKEGQPEDLGRGVGALMADYIPLLPSGARRAGAARVMAARLGRSPSFLVRHPIKTQLMAMGLGTGLGWAARGEDMPARLALAFGPLLLTQFLRRQELKGIQKRYDKEKRKRLRELDEDDLLGGRWWGGSSKLGATAAWEAMRRRKYRNYGSLAEAGDSLMLATGLNPLMVPITAGIDNAEAGHIRKKADFYDQRNSPTIPLYLLAALAGSAGMEGSRMWSRREFGKAAPLPREEWRALSQHVSGGDPLIYEIENLNNAYYGKPRSSEEAHNFLRSGLGDQHDPDTDAGRERIRHLLREGVIVADSKASPGMIAHEAGHARIERTPGVVRFLQRNVYPHSRWISPLSSAGSMAAGLASGSALRGALLGTLIGGVTGLGTLAPEAGASYNAMQGLKSYEGGTLSRDQLRPLAAALSTYLAGGVLPSTLSGAAGGWISGKRRKKRRRQRNSDLGRVIRI